MNHNIKDVSKMNRAECLNFRQLYDSLRGDLTDEDRDEYDRHLRVCGNCKREREFIQNTLMPINDEFKSRTSSVGTHDTAHIPRQLKERYFSGAISRSRIDEIEDHIKACPSCSEEFKADSASATREASEEERKILREIEAAEVCDRLSLYRNQFAPVTENPLRKKRLARSEGFWHRINLLPVLSRATAATVLLILIGYFAYQEYKAYRALADVEGQFRQVVSTVLVRDFELRPTGGFRFNRVGKVRGEEAEAEPRQLPKQFVEALNRDSDNPELLQQIATILLFEDQLGKAEEYYRRASDMGNAGGKVLNDLAVIESRKRDYGKALTYLQAALEVDSALQEAQYNLATVYELKNDKIAAVKAWQKYLEIDPDIESEWNKVARTHLIKLRE